MSDVDNPITGSHSCPSPTSKRSDIMSMPDSASQASDACTTVIVTVTPSVALLQALLGYIVPDSWAARDEYTGSNIGLAYKVGAMDYAQEVVSRATMPRPVRVEMKIPDGHQGGRNMAKQVVEVYAVLGIRPLLPPTFLGLSRTRWPVVAYAGYLAFHYRNELRIIGRAVVAGLHLVIDRWERWCWWSLKNSEDRENEEEEDENDEAEERVGTASDIRNTETMLLWQQSQLQVMRDLLSLQSGDSLRGSALFDSS